MTSLEEIVVRLLPHHPNLFVVSFFKFHSNSNPPIPNEPLSKRWIKGGGGGGGCLEIDRYGTHIHSSNSSIVREREKYDGR